MSRCTSKMSGGVARANLVDHGVLLKPVSCNPFLGAVHDGTSTGYMQGYAAKPIHWLYRFRHNLLPQGMATGFFSRNPYGRYVHWLEVSTIEKIRLQLQTMESMPCSVVTSIVVMYTLWFSYRLTFLHPDITLYNLGLWPTKPWVQQQRFNKKIELDQPVYRWVHRVPEFMAVDPARELYKLNVQANDPYLEYVRGMGREKELTLYPSERTGGKGDILPLNLRHEDHSGHHPGPLTSSQGL
ncbi:putative mitochondrial P27 protein, putative (P27) [Leptomonas pyrrhocoris]|uniref:Putative mitochondrial P27 protein, putative (P27) n=1 Tax=Leptomonas pyrrhocoris TaxID=157538 RepID=A0A0N0DZL2_LEPPY|nr:putative mitochondrial P27 protein, putative (P27) [Leptomonas pyrrhocoris]XP_015663867.1 putative mitochondrial P27 protein, putative (P27) [Leptomonas pyrrhocoris]KPA85427.1 putative mitochondrial P27 protein, putative (P27) [Leptomonas pyrrhocoris]KPA85428.1 putative mitochondrial P27 protein, putative (P27) [Leptomonas pyrrhocoris]|eukprot:XP_015663866.1 putative mitochondrial P27 protein, putative (P27) [Leptomonas pyrrhocoris]